jgi:uncharacterized membrane protein
MSGPSLTRNRIYSIDLLRGLVMVIMALDHVRDFFHNDAFLHDPLDLKTTTPALFFTRWITHFCAPTFLLLAGTSAYLLGLKKSKAELSSFLIKRGFWLIFIELIITFAVTFNPLYNIIVLQVIWATGISMIILGLLIWLPFPVILTLGICIVFGHNMLDYPEDANNQKVGFWWDLIHHGRFTFYPYAQNRGILIAYAFLPWTGIMVMGYCMGKLFEPAFNALKRRKILIYLGLGLVLLFFVLRGINEYGNPFPWSEQRNGIYTFLSFMNVQKYPPSLMYVCITIGPALIFLALTEKIQNKLGSVLIIYGKVPLFYYVIHFFLIHAICVITLSIVGYSLKDAIVPQFPFRPQFGFDLLGVYIFWLLVLVIMYPLCRWYSRYKGTHHQWWLSYL